MADRVAVRTARQLYVCPSCHFQSQVSRHGLRKQFFSVVSQSRQLDKLPPPRSTTKDPCTGLQTRSRNLSRPASSLASSSAINAPTQIPAKYRTLHERLSKLQEEAAGYVDLSKLQLALRSLESEHSTTRIAFLTLDPNAAVSARRLAKALLSDPLGKQESWEQELLATNSAEAVLLRYGQPGDIVGDNGLLHTILVPSKFLKDNHVEILIAPLRSETETLHDTPGTTKDDLLVPAIAIPAAHGRTAFVRSPVHRTIVIGSGIAGATQFGRLRRSNRSDAIDWLLDSSVLPASSQSGDLMIVNTELATTALDRFRLDDGAGAAFSQAWLDSSVPQIAQLVQDLQEEPMALQYAASLLDATHHALEQDEQRLLTQARSVAVPDATRADLQQAVSRWSSQSHRDLRDNLLAAFTSRAWRRTVWWRLLWRIDDVTYSTSDIVSKCWLNESEQTLAYLSGRIYQADLATEDDLKETAFVNKEWTAFIQEGIDRHEAGRATAGPTVPELIQMPSMLSRVQQQSGVNPLFDPPWPHTIALARQTMLHTLVPEMHRKAQGLLLTAYTTIGGTAALGGWLWVASAGTALYESGAIVALGLVWSFRRLQKRWGKERETFADTAQENGRKVLTEIETHLRKLVREGGATDVLAEDAERIARAKDALHSCNSAVQGAGRVDRS